MSEKGKKIAKWLGIILFIIFGTVLFSERHTKILILILICMLPFLLYFKKYKSFFGLLVVMGGIFVADVVVHHSCCSVIGGADIGKGYIVTTPEMLKQVQHEENVAEVCKITKVDAFHELNGVTVERDNTTNCVHVKSARVDKIWNINDNLSYHTADDEGNVVSILTNGDGLVHISVFPDSLVVSGEPNDPETIKNFEAQLNNEYVL